MEDWERLRDISDDKEQLEDTWFEWNDGIHKLEDLFRQKGVVYEEILIDLDELIQYCRREELKIDAESRSRFTVKKLWELHAHSGENCH